MTIKNDEPEICSCNIIHQDVVDRAKENMVEDQSAFELAELFKIFGDKTRIRILNALFISEMCVCDIAALLGMTQSAISHQIKVLRQSKLVRNRKEGKVVYYSLADDHVKNIFDQGMNHINE